jgi:unsaturated rhamnogalacturonyl hydrolase
VRLSRLLRHLPPAAITAAGILLTSAFTLQAAELHVTVRNDLPIARPSETVEIAASALAPLGSDLTRIHVFDHDTGREVLAQTLDLDGNGTAESLIFQTDMKAQGVRSFDLRIGEHVTYRKEDFHVYGRFVRERYDDFAWENDRVAHRMYGAALETWQKEPLTSSTVDVWLKRTRRLIVNDWYMVDDYHHDTGEGADFYSAGRSRGCGGSGIWRDGKLIVSKNFRDSRVLANGPIRLVFELKYSLWDAAGIRSETKRITLDAGQNFNRFESRYDVDGKGDLQYATGLKKFPATDVRIERDAGWIRAWGPVVGGTGKFGCAVVIDPASIVDVTEADGNHLIVAKAPAVYYAGTGWDKSGDFADVAEWDRYVQQWAQRVKSPLRVEVVVTP